MKKGLRFALAGSLLTAAIITLSTSEPKYTPVSLEEQSAAGAAAYLHGLRANQITGTVNQEDIQSAIESLADMPESAIGLNWAERGPNNRGGRTRGLAINPTDPSEMYVGSVSGGLYKSNNSGLSWTEVNPDQENLAVMTIAYSKDGDVYYGTGEGLYNTWTTGYGASTSSGFPGAGVFKKGVNDAGFTQLASTDGFSSVGAIVTDPTNNDKVYIGTSSGIRLSTNGGSTWSNPLQGQIGSNGTCWDIHMDAGGNIWGTLGGRTMKSADGGSTWDEVSKSSAGSTGLPRSGGRIMFASAANDEDYVYVVQITSGNALAGVYRTTDGGDTWSKIGQKSTYFDPFCSSQCQGEYDLAVGVDPSNKNRVIVGGITVWEWEQGQGWNQVNGFGPYNIHSDNHDVVWHPTDSSKVYIVNDGGVYFSNNGGDTWQTLNKNYVTTQFYDIGISADRYVVGGTQDNGSWVMDGLGNTTNEGRSLGAVDGFSGDGGYSTISWLVPKIYFTEYQQGRIGRSENKGQSFTSFWDNRVGQAIGSWMTPFYLYENSDDALSVDSVQFKVDRALRSLGFANAGQDTFVSNIAPLQASAVMNAATFKVQSGTAVISSDASGNLSGDGTGNFDAATGNFTVIFNSSPAAEIIATVDVSYAGGSEVVLGSNTNGLPFKYILPNSLGMGDSVIVQDPVSSMFIVGFSGSVWMTRGALDFSTTPEWYKLASITGTTQAVEVSADGNYAWIGTENGRLYRIAGLAAARDYGSADADSGATAVTVDLVQNFMGRNISGIAVDPNDNDRVLVTLGNYGNANYVYYSGNATSTSPNFLVKDGNLGNFPVYAATFDKGNSAYAVLGTEYGIFSTQNINTTSPQWGADNSGLARVPVFTLKQYRTNKSSTADMTVEEGDIFAGTFGRGAFQTTSLMTTRPIGIAEQEVEQVQETMKLFPNPAENFTTLALELPAGSYTVELIDLNGRSVKAVVFEATENGAQTFKLDISSVANGMYIVGVKEAPGSFARLLIAH
ncbi:T9SS type A sorting domain-containing protein [Schleiferiaceae bacterium]|nr:T9SS type A sorting domain-containing protein [Schleiferiaceae bacterium]